MQIQLLVSEISEISGIKFHSQLFRDEVKNTAFAYMVRLARTWLKRYSLHSARQALAMRRAGG